MSTPAGDGFSLLQFNSPAPGTRVVVVERTSDAGRQVRFPLFAQIRRPDGLIVTRGGVITTELAGTSTVLVPRVQGRSRVIEITRTPPEVQRTNLAIGAKFKLFKLQWGQRLEATVAISKRTRVGFDTFGTVQFLYAADGKERRFTSGETGTVVLAPGTYRFLFVGDDEARITLVRLPLNL